MLLVAPGLLADLPQPALAAVVIAASLSLADIAGMRRLRRQRASDFRLALAAFLGVAFLGVLPGSPSPSACPSPTCSDVPGGRTRPSWAGSAACPATTTRPTTRPSTTCRAWSSTASTRPSSSPTPAPSATRSGTSPHGTPRPTWIVVAAEPITDVDTTAADMLVDLDAELDALGITLVFAELKDPVRRRIERYELTDAIEDASLLRHGERGGGGVPHPGRGRLAARSLPTGPASTRRRPR